MRVELPIVGSPPAMSEGLAGCDALGLTSNASAVVQGFVDASSGEWYIRLDHVTGEFEPGETVRITGNVPVDINVELAES